MYISYKCTYNICHLWMKQWYELVREILAIGDQQLLISYSYPLLLHWMQVYQVRWYVWYRVP
jgi:hypothetical protein